MNALVDLPFCDWSFRRFFLARPALIKDIKEERVVFIIFIFIHACPSWIAYISSFLGGVCGGWMKVRGCTKYNTIANVNIAAPMNDDLKCCNDMTPRPFLFLNVPLHIYCSPNLYRVTLLEPVMCVSCTCSDILNAVAEVFCSAPLSACDIFSQFFFFSQNFIIGSMTTYCMYVCIALI